MKHFWIGLALTCVAAAAILLWRQQYDTAFVIATVGALSWFLNYRMRMKELVAASDEEEERKPGEERRP